MKRFALAALLLLVLGAVAYESYTSTSVRVAEDGTPPPPSFP